MRALSIEKYSIL